MYLMIEAWTPRPAWPALTPDEGCDALRAAIAEAGWYEYFDQVDPA